jgi:hypothetical protein
VRAQGESEIMSSSCLWSRLRFAAGALLLSALLGGCVSKACPDGQKLTDGKCVEKNATAAHGGGDAGMEPGGDGGIADAAVAGDAATGSDVDASDASTGCDTNPLNCWQDDDDDGYATSDAASMSVACESQCPAGWTKLQPVDGNVDCKDSDSKVRPRRCWRDTDMDGYAGDAQDDSVFCAKQCPAGWTAKEPKEDDVDCSDTSAFFNPEATETCNGRDNDCDGKVDEGADETCSVANGTGECTRASCKIGKCETGFADCDGSYLTGCEVVLSTLQNCGACGVACDPLASCEATAKKSVGDCVCPAPSFGDGTVCHGLGPMAAGWRATCAIDSKLAASCWGVASTATAIPDEKYLQLSLGQTVGCGILANRHLRCWGATITPDNTTFMQVVVGNDYVCGLTTAGTAICWGFGSSPAAYGEISAPDEQFVQLTGGYYHVCGLRADGVPKCWGAGSFDRTPDCMSLKYDCGQAQPPPDEKFVQLAAGMVHTCGLRADGSVKCWGAGVTSGTEASALKYGQAQPPDEEFSWISAGYVHNCGIRKSDGTAVCWGAGTAEGTANYDQQQSVPPDASFAVLSAGLFQTCGLTTQHQIVCWGSAADGGQGNVSGVWPFNPGHD